MVLIDGASLTSDEIAAVARRRAGVDLAPDALERAGRSYDLAERLSAERSVYGRSTGVGANRDVGVTDAAAHARSLMRSHATSAGPVRAPERVRAMLVVRLNQLAAGGSGTTPSVLRRLAAMLADDALPTVREHGSIGTGDLAALATTVLALTGETSQTGHVRSATTPTAHDALPFMSSNAAAIGDAALGGTDLLELARATVAVAGLTFRAVDGNPEAFAPVVERVTPFDGARQVCRWMRSLTTGGAPATRIQDPFGLRTLPQAHGPALDALAALRDVVGRLANAPSENPVVLPDDSGGGGALAHHGGFHAAYLTTALDTALVAVAQSAKLTLARLSMLNEPAFTGLPPFLADATPGSSGVMMLEYVGASALGRLRSAATPVGLQTVVLSRGVEDDASFASLAARLAIDAVADLRALLACELVAAVRALRMRRVTAAGHPLAQVLDACAELPDDVEDRELTRDVELAEVVLPTLGELLASGVR